MPQELVYTSVPQGLDLQARGYCTVARTQGLGVQLQRYLESLSIFNLDSASSQQPCFFHLRYQSAGKRLHIVARMSGCGVDYSQRGIFIAHHVVVDSAELPAAGPVWLATRGDLFRSRWDGPPEEIRAPKRIPPGSAQPGVARTWKRLTGDAGWAGQLAACVREGSTVWIICEPTTPVLQLFSEAAVLLPESDRWKATFTTNYQAGTIPSNVSFHWRAVYAGTKEAQDAKSRRSGMVVDLTGQVEEAPRDAHGLVEFARSGESPTPSRQRTGAAETPSKEPRQQSMSGTYGLRTNEANGGKSNWDAMISEVRDTGQTTRRSRQSPTHPQRAAANTPTQNRELRPHSASDDVESSYGGLMVGIISATVGLALLLAVGMFFYSRNDTPVTEGMSAGVQREVQEIITKVKQKLEPLSNGAAELDSWSAAGGLKPFPDELARSLSSTVQRVKSNSFQRYFDIVRDYAPSRHKQILKERDECLLQAKESLARANHVKQIQDDLNQFKAQIAQLDTWSDDAGLKPFPADITTSISSTLADDESESFQQKVVIVRAYAPEKYKALVEERHKCVLHAKESLARANNVWHVQTNLNRLRNIEDILVMIEGNSGAASEMQGRELQRLIAELDPEVLPEHAQKIAKYKKRISDIIDGLRKNDDSPKPKGSRPSDPGQR